MPIIPNHIFIPAIGVNTTTSPAPTVMEWDQYVQKEVAGFGVPPETKEGLLQTTWWSDGPKPGSTGMAIVLGHSNVGIFDNIGRLKAGQLVGLTDGHALDTFRVIGVPRTGIPKTDGSALQRALLVHPTTARLALVTCSGAFNGSSSGENTVVYLELVSAKVVGK
jgi:sortase (surface protein transpeptidase)